MGAKSGGRDAVSFDYEIGPQAAQDRAKQFMGARITRGIVELLTNSDAAYARLGDGRQRKHRPINITVNHPDRYFEIKDRAGGMSPGTVREKFTKGGATSTAGHRGYFGLGAKDCAVFGSLELGTVDGEGRFSTVEIPGDFRDCNLKHKDASGWDYEKIHGEKLRLSGTAVRINVDSTERGGARIPRLETLERDLRTHYALRSLLGRNRVRLTVITGRKSAEATLVYPGFPWENNHKAKEIENNMELRIPGYPESRPRLVLYKFPEPIDGDPKDETFEGFVLIGSGDIADYGFTLAGLESQTHARRLAGHLDDMYIQRLLDEYRAEGASKTNPSPVISQDRKHRNGGLEDSHPYAKALMNALRPILQKALEEMQAESKETSRAGISEDLEEVNRNAGRFLSDMFDAGGQGPEPKPLRRGFYFLPSTRDLRRNDPGWISISIYSIGEGTDEGEEVRLSLGESGICELESDAVSLAEMKNRQDGLRASVRLRAGPRLGATTLSASADGNSAEATVRVVDNPKPEIRFMFEREKYSVKPGRRRKVGVFVPESLIEEEGANDVNIRIGDSRGGIVLRGLPKQNVLGCPFDGERIAYVAAFEFEGRRIGARAELTATFRDLRAEAVITVGGGSVEIYFDDLTNPAPDQRSKVYEVASPCGVEEHLNETCLHVFTRHPRMEPYLGEPTETEDSNIFWNLNDSPGFRAMCADCIAEAAAEFKIMGSVTTRDEIPPQDLFDSFWKEKKSVLAKMQEIYIDGAKWEEQKKLADDEDG